MDTNLTRTDVAKPDDGQLFVNFPALCDPQNQVAAQQLLDFFNACSGHRQGEANFQTGSQENWGEPLDLSQQQPTSRGVDEAKLETNIDVNKETNKCRARSSRNVLRRAATTPSRRDRSNVCEMGSDKDRKFWGQKHLSEWCDQARVQADLHNRKHKLAKCTSELEQCRQELARIQNQNLSQKPTFF